jgi:cytochrome c-type biogenesis protein CcmH
MRTALLTLFVTAALAAPAVAQGPSAKQQAADLAGQLMSPFCPGRLLVDCTSSQAYDLRDEIARRIAAGELASAVKAGLVRQYGSGILGAPAAQGVGWLAWLLPALLAMVTAGAVAVKVGQAVRVGPPVPAAAGAGAVDAAALTRLDDELRDLD